MEKITYPLTRTAAALCAAVLLLAAMACTFSLGGDSQDPSAERTMEAAYLQQTLEAQITLMAGTSRPEEQPTAQAEISPQPAAPCLVAFHSEREGGEAKIFVFDPAGGSPGLLISSAAADRSPVFSPACQSSALLASVIQAPIPQDPAGEAQTAAAPDEPELLIREVRWDRTAFHCVKGNGPTTLTFTADMSDVDRGLAIFWRLYEKGSGRMTDWENVSMTRKGGSERTFTFNADAWNGVNNFFYPPLFGESWFQFQFVSGDAQERTPVYRSEVTFFPCAQ